MTNFLILSTLIVNGLLLFLFINSYLFYVHMFQLNSYFTDRYLKWFKKNKFKKSPILHRNKDKKIPLKFTDRVKRLSVTFVLILFVVYILYYVLSYYTSFLVFYVLSLIFGQTGGGFNSVTGLFIMILIIRFIYLIIFYSLVPYLIILANFINKPIEKKINKSFYDDAKNILLNHKDLKVIGITGSFGKTSVKHFLTTLLECEYETLMSPGNFNTTMGAIRTVREYLKPTHQVFVCEMGAKQVNDIKEICDLVNPDIAIITSIGEMHLETFGSIDNIIKTKFELADAVKTSGTVFLNYDNEYIKNKEINQKYISYSLNENSDYRATEIVTSNDGTQFKVVTKDGDEQVYSTKLIGLHNILNVACCISVCHQLGISLQKLVPYVKKIESVQHRLELKNNGNMTIIDDAYNSNPVGSKMALDCVSTLKGHKIVITPGMIELGEKEYLLNKEFGKYMLDKVDSVLLIGEEQTKPIYEGLLEVGFNTDNIKVFDKFTEAFSYSQSLCNVYEKVSVLIENDLPDNF